MKITIYSMPNYTGSSHLLPVGTLNLNSFTNPDEPDSGEDQLQSIRIPQGMKVTLYDQDNVTGNAKIFVEDTPDSNFTSASLRVETITPEQFAVYKSILLITDTADAEALINCGFTSAEDIIKMDLQSFIRTCANALGSETQATNIYNRAAALLQTATLYFAFDYTGISRVLTVGNYNTIDPVFPDDRLSSLQVQHGLKVTLFDDYNFGGESRVFIEDIPALTDFNDRASSLKIESITEEQFVIYQSILDIVHDGNAEVLISLGFTSANAVVALDRMTFINRHSQPLGGDDKAGAIYDRAVVVSQSVAAYTSPNYTGHRQLFSPGNYTRAALLVTGGIGDDRLRSLQVLAGYKVTLYADDNFTGTAQIFIEDVADVDANNSNRTTSLTVELIAPNMQAAYRRILRITNNSNAEVLIANGFTSAYSIAYISRTNFIDKYGQQLGGNTNAATLYDKAAAIQAQSVHLMAAAHSTAASPYAQAMPSNNSGELANHFQSLKGYEQMFGSLNYCECSECESIFGPAAYFVDLMRIADKAITTSNEIPVGLSLKERRPDLFAIELTCENTNTTIPYLQVVNEILEETVVNNAGSQNNGSNDALQIIASSGYPSNLPYNYYLDYIRTSLLQMRTGIADIISVFSTANYPDGYRYADAFAAETLNLSFELYSFITSQNADISSYGLKSETDISELQKVSSFLYCTGITYNELKELLYQGTSEGDTNTHLKFFINRSQPLSQAPLSIIETSDGTEQLNYLDAAVAATLSRFIRLARQLQWSFADLDWVLSSLDFPEISRDAVIALANVKRLTQKLSLPPSHVSSLWSYLRTDGLAGQLNPGSPFYTVFGFEANVLDDEKQLWIVSLPDVPTEKDLQDIKESNIASKKILAGVNLPQQDLLEIAKGILVKDAENKIELTVSSLSALYRHAILMKYTMLPAGKYLALLEITGIEEPAVLSPAQAIDLLSAADRIKALGLDITDLDFIISKKETRHIHPVFAQDNLSAITEAARPLIKEAIVPKESNILIDDKNVLANRLVLNSSLEKNIEDTVDNIQHIIKNKNRITEKSFEVIEPQPARDKIMGWLKQKQYIASDYSVLKATLDEAARKSLADILSSNISEAYKKDLIGYAEKLKKFKENIAGLLHADEPVIASVFNGLCLLKTDLPKSGDTDDKPLTDFISLLARWLVLAKKLNLNHQDLTFIFSHLTVFKSSATGSVPDVNAIHLEDIKTFRKMKQLAAINDTGSDKLMTLFEPPANTSLSKQNQVNLLNHWFDWGVEYSYYLLRDTDRISTIDELYRMKQSMDIYAASGIDVYSQDALRVLPLLKASADNWSFFSNSLQAVLAALQVTAGDAQWGTVSKSLGLTMNERRRSALMPYCIWKLGERFADITNARTLSEYLLIDVEMSGCAEISYIKQALNTVQLYLQRCRLQLEQKVTISTDNLPDIWWEWIMNFRIWQANRKVFLYPENYIDPSLRKTKTSLFTDLENSLRQGDINRENVEEAFAKYMTGFEKLAKLQYVDACNYIVHDTERGPIDTLFLFACTYTSPNEYYYITREAGVTWGEWQKIEVSINADYITPVYAFSRLFVFWVEVTNHQETDPTIDNNINGSIKATVWKATIKYSFLNFSGKWVQPQTLVTDIVFNIETQDNLIGNISGLLAADKIDWRKVYVLTVPEDASRETEERLMICYGYLFSKIDWSLYSGYKFIKGKSFTDFSNNLTSAITKSPNRAFDDPNARSFFYTSFMNINLIISDSDFDTEKLFLMPDAGTHVPLFRFATNVPSPTPVNNTLLINSSGSGRDLHAINNNTSSFVLSFPRNVETITVKNNSSKFIYSADGESVLVEGGSVVNISNNTIFQEINLVLDAELMPFAKMTSVFNIYNEAERLQRLKAYLQNEHIISIGPESRNFVIATQQQTDQLDLEHYVIEEAHSGPHQSTFSAEFFNPDQIRSLKALLSDRKNSSIAILYDSDQNTTSDAKPFIAQRLTTNAITSLSRRLFSGGIDDLLSTESQSQPATPKKLFQRLRPSSDVVPPVTASADQVDFTGPYGNYYWELFFHAPMLIGSMLNTNQQFAESQKWLNYIFNPTKSQYWQFYPFRSYTVAETLIQQLQNQQEISTYESNPFDPHAIARLRIGAYEKAVVMQYIDNLLDWGDNMFSQYTWESLTTATMLYMYAYDLLGAQPQSLGECTRQAPTTFADIQSEYAGTGIPEFLIQLEELVGDPAPQLPQSQNVPFNNINTYFGIPENDQFTAYWDRVEDRLYKIRNCLNLQGVSQPLALFEPPINPMALVKAVAANSSLAAAGASFAGGAPPYRFSVIIEKAKGFVQTVIQLGSTLLSVLEKNDAEALSLIRSKQQMVVLNMTTAIKQQQIDQLKSTLDSTQYSLTSAKYRSDHYNQLINENYNTNETVGLNLVKSGLAFQSLAAAVRGLAIPAYLIPNIFGLADGGFDPGNCVAEGAALSDSVGQILYQSSLLTSTVAQYQRRKEDWQLQKQVADNEYNQISSQIESLQAQIEAAGQELNIHLTDIEQTNEVDDFLRSKFSSTDLYQWMTGRIATMYYETYTLARNLCGMAQQAYNYELDTNDSSFLASDYWDSLRKGLLAGEGLMFSLQQMEQSFLTQSARKLEIEKTVSLRQYFPEDFLYFKYGGPTSGKGTLSFRLKQSLFDMDFSGHYKRKIKYISISIPAIVGPYQNVNATLTLNSSAVAMKADTGLIDWVNDYLLTSADDVKTDLVPRQVAISKGTDDTGSFSLDFRDEMYMPFEGAGAVSDWTLTMPPETNRFNFDSITDVVLKIYYTAASDGKFANDVKTQYKNLPVKNYLFVNTLSVKQSFPSAFRQFFNMSPDSNGNQAITFGVNPVLPGGDKGKTDIKEVLVKLITRDIDLTDLANLKLYLPILTSAEVTMENGVYKFLPDSRPDALSSGQWSLVFGLNGANALNDTSLLDVVVVTVYEAPVF